MFKAKKILSFLFACALIFSVGSTGVFAAENSPEQNHLQTAITEGKSAPVASSPELSEEEAYQIIEKLNESAEIIEVEVTRPSTAPSSEVGTKSVEIAKVKCRPIYGYEKLNGTTGHVSVHLEIWVEGGGVSALINKVTGYAAFATNVEGVRENISYIPVPPFKRVYVTEESNIKINFDTDEVMWKGYADVSLLGGWSNADIFFDHQRDL